MAGFRTLLRSVALVAFVATATSLWADRQNVRQLQPTDSLVLKAAPWTELTPGRMAHSAYPVQLFVRGRSLKVTSRYEQILPIYTKSGTLYIAMQLNPGVNWLHGLPRGRYRINNRTINIR